MTCKPIVIKQKINFMFVSSICSWEERCWASYLSDKEGDEETEETKEKRSIKRNDRKDQNGPWTTTGTKR